MKRMTQLLVADTDPLFACYLQVSLQEAGFVVHMASDGAEALSVAQRLPIDLVIVDAQVIEAAGLALCPALRKRRDVPVIVLSASKLPEDMMVAFLAGADDYIAKPFSLREVTVRIQKLVESATQLTRRDHRVNVDQGERYGHENPHSTRG